MIMRFIKQKKAKLAILLCLSGLILCPPLYAGDSILPGDNEPNSAGNFMPTGSSLDTGLSIHNGEVWVWGFRGSGQQGNGTMVVNQRSAPAKVKIFSEQNIKIVALTAGAYHMIALDENGDVWGWGQSGYGETGCGTGYVTTPCKVLNGKKITIIGAGEYFSAAMGEDGKVYTWGHGIYGQRGDGLRTSYLKNAKQPGTVHEVDLKGEKARLLGVAYETAYVVTHSGKVMGWGDNEDCELGVMTGKSICSGHEYVTTPREFTLSGINPNNIIQITGGNAWGQVLMNNGDVWGWGRGASVGQTSNGSTHYTNNSATPRKVLDNVAYLYGRYVGSAALTKSGKFYTWGQTSGSAFDIYGHKPTLRESPHGVIEGFGGGKEHLYYWTFDGKAYAVGYGAAYKLLPNSTKNIPWPGEEMTFLLEDD